MPHFTQDKKIINYSIRISSAKSGNGLALVIQDFSYKNILSRPYVLVITYDKNDIYVPKNNGSYLLKKPFFGNYYVSSAEPKMFDSYTLLCNSFADLDNKYDPKYLKSSNGRFFVTVNEYGTFFQNTVNQDLAEKLTSNHFVENFFANQSVDLWSGTSAHEQKFGKIPGNYFDINTRKLLTGYLTLPVYNNPENLETVNDCSFEYFDTAIPFLEVETKCPTITENGLGFITDRFVKVGNSYYSLSNSIAIFSKDRSGYSDYIVFTKDAVYGFYHQGSNSSFKTSKFKISSTGKASNWDNTKIEQHSCSDNYIASDYDSLNMFMVFKKNCHEFLDPAPLKADGTENSFDYQLKQLNGDMSPVDCVSILQLPLDKFFAANSGTFEKMSVKEEDPFRWYDIEVELENANFPLVNITSQITKKTISSISRDVVPSDYFSYTAKYPLGKFVKGPEIPSVTDPINLGRLDNVSLLQKIQYGNSIKVFESYPRACNCDLHVTSIKYSGTTAVLGNPVINSQGQIISIPVIYGGIGYTTPPIITISGGNGSGATATPIVSNGIITGVSINNGGSGYTSTPTATLGSSGNSGTATVSSTIINNSGQITSINIGNSGSNYTSNPTVTISGGGGTGATAVATVSNGIVTGVTITNPGTGYTSNPTVILSSPGFLGNDPVAINGSNWKFQITVDSSQQPAPIEFGGSNLIINLELIDQTTNQIVPLNGFFNLLISPIGNDSFSFNIKDSIYTPDTSLFEVKYGKATLSISPLMLYTKEKTITDAKITILPALKNTAYSITNVYGNSFNYVKTSDVNLPTTSTFNVVSLNNQGISTFKFRESIATSKNSSVIFEMLYQSQSHYLLSKDTKYKPYIIFTNTSNNSTLSISDFSITKESVNGKTLYSVSVDNSTQGIVNKIEGDLNVFNGTNNFLINIQNGSFYMPKDNISSVITIDNKYGIYALSDKYSSTFNLKESVFP